MEKITLEEPENKKATLSDKLKGGINSLFSIFKKKDNTIKFKTSEEAMGEIYKLMVELDRDRKEEQKEEQKELKNKDNQEEKRNQELIKALKGLSRPKRKPKPKKKVEEKKEEPTKPPEKPVEPTKPPAKPAEVPKPAEAPKPPPKVEPAKPAPKPPTKPTPAPKPPAKPVEAPKPPAKPVEAPKPPAKPVEAPKPPPKAEPVKPPEAPKPPPKVEPAKPPPKVEPKIKEPILPKGIDSSTKKMIMQHEGVVPYPYKDSKGLWTIGVGHLIGDGKTLPPEYAAYKNNGGPFDKNNNKTPVMTNEQVEKLFDDDYEKHKKMAMKTPGWDMANETGQAAMIDLAFNMGGDWYKTWPNTSKALAAGDFNKAADGLKDSKWYTQVKSRAVKIVDMIRNGKKTATADSSLITSTTGQKVDSASKENQQLNMQAEVNANKNKTIVNNIQTSVSSSQQIIPQQDKVDDRPAILKKGK